MSRSRCAIACRGFPTDFPVVGYSIELDDRRSDGRGFPTDFPVVGSCRSGIVDEPCAVASLPISPW